MAAGGSGALRRRVIVWVAVGAVLGVAFGLVLGRRRAPPLTGERLAAARALWQERAPASYRLEMKLGGAVKDRRVIEVEGRRVVRMTTDGAPVPPVAWPYWSVEGLFDFLATELENAAQAERTYGVAPGTEVVLQAAFDPDNGIPRRFYRHVMGARRQDVRWSIVAFEASGPETGRGE